jgi:beta-lactamase regulating signal transducer with metallopeptidase domain
VIAGILNHLWQSTLFAAGAGLLTLGLRNSKAKIRYWLWFAGSVKFLIPFSFLVKAGHALAPSAAPVTVLPAPLYLVQQAAQPFAANAAPVLAMPVATGLEPVVALWGVWGLGVALVLIFWLHGWLRIGRALRQATPRAIPAPIPVKTTATTLGPGLFGLWRPTLLLPDGIAGRLTAQELNAVIAHELCHLKRRDNLTAVVHMIVEALFWFHPLVWWIGARMNVERERACDEGVVQSGNEPAIYADSILKVCHFYAQSPLPCASGVSSAALMERLETIMNLKTADRLKPWQKTLMAGSTVLAIAWPLLTGWVAALQDDGLWFGVPSAPEVAQAAADDNRPHKAVAIDPQLFDRYTGYYEWAPNVVMRVVRQGSHYYQGVVGPLREMFPESQTKFFFKDFAGQISFEVGGDGRIASIWHVQGNEKRVYKISAQRAHDIDAARAWRIKYQIPSPGTEDALRYFIAQAQEGRVPSESMTPAFLVIIRPLLPSWVQVTAKWGPLQSLRFTSVDWLGRDYYDATFAHTTVRWLIEPLEGGKLNGMYWREIFARKDRHVASLGTEASLRGFINALEQGQPDYGDIDSATAIRLTRQQLPIIRGSFKNWGRLKSLSFVSADDEGMDIYEANFERGQSEWRIAPLTQEGKIQRIYFPNTDIKMGG